MGMPSCPALRAAMNMDFVHCSLKVPMLITRAAAIPTISSTSWSAWAMTGEAPMASRALAVEFITT